MSLRWKFAILLGSLAAASAIAASVVGYAATKSQLYDQITESVRSAALSTAAIEDERVARAAARAGITERPPPLTQPPPILDSPIPGSDEGLGGEAPSEDHEGRESEQGFVFPDFAETAHADEPERHHFPRGNRLLAIQVIGPNGRIVSWQRTRLPVDARTKLLAREGSAGRRQPPVILSTVRIGGENLRLAVTPLARGGAVQVARSTRDAEQTLENLKERMIFLTITIVALAALVGVLIANRSTRSLERLTESAEEVAATGSPNANIAVAGSDEIGRLGRSFSRMLASLAESKEQQQRFVQDAGHELRTPLTSMTTNLAVLDQLDRLSPEDRKRLLDDLRSETAEMSALVNELVELTDGSADEEFRRLDLADIAQRTAKRATRRSGREVVVTGPGGTVNGQQRGLERAVSNLVDNAIKFDPSGEAIEIRVDGPRVTVLDHGPGINPGDEAKIFDRFHRSVEARNVPGSGLGLSIVQQIVDRHNGSTSAKTRDGGGAEIGFTLSEQVES